MTDNEIIKALECCENADCTNCPCYVGGSLQCMGISYSKLHDLFIRQKAEIENLKNDYRKTLTKQIELCDTILHQKTEIERLKYLLVYEEGKYDKCAKRFYKEGVRDFYRKLIDKATTTLRLRYGETEPSLAYSIYQEELDEILNELGVLQGDKSDKFLFI